jgi:hypothetical protein
MERVRKDIPEALPFQSDRETVWPLDEVDSETTLRITSQRRIRRALVKGEVKGVPRIPAKWLPGRS